MEWLRYYRQVWVVDFEFQALPGERPAPRCVVARELKSDRLVRSWLEGSIAPPVHHSPLTPTSCSSPITRAPKWVVFFRSVGSCRFASWIFSPSFEIPRTAWLCRAGMDCSSALAYHGLPALEGVEKEFMRSMALRDGPFSDTSLALLDYCQSDVDALSKLLSAMGPKIDLPRALLRGRYMAAAARIETHGVSVDVETLGLLRDHWPELKGRLIERIDERYRVFVRADQAPINPDTPLGSAILATAKIGTSILTIWRTLCSSSGRGRDQIAIQAEALRVARRETGLTIDQISRWENSGRDDASWPGLDGKGTRTGGEYPELGIGRGYGNGRRARASRSSR